MREKMVSPPSCQHFASGAGKFSQRIQSSASLRTWPLMHFAYITLSLRSGSSGLTLGDAIFGMKNLHQGTVLYLPCSHLLTQAKGLIPPASLLAYLIGEDKFIIAHRVTF